ncbi:MAG TPA: ParB N-terminal domain-containing protein, partial [Chloroflexota bacterium]|nr:ParB N-terminal domain-containing protein [Chloroflexota bacterium]
MPASTETKYDIRVVDVELIDPDKRNIRQGKIDAQHVETLRLALRAALERGEEFDHPITIYPNSAKRYTIKHGHRRFAAARLEGVRQLHFHVVGAPSERGRILDQL